MVLFGAPSAINGRTVLTDRFGPVTFTMRYGYGTFTETSAAHPDYKRVVQRAKRRRHMARKKRRGWA